MSLNKTNIEWCDFTANPMRGRCPHFGTTRCGTYCYAERIRLRFKQPAEYSFHPEVLETIKRKAKPSTIFIGSTFDIFAKRNPEAEVKQVLSTMAEASQHTIITLTKNPRRATSMIHLDYVNADIRHVWWGISITSHGQYDPSELIVWGGLKRRFISVEPLLGPIDNIPAAPFYIIGAQTGPGAVVPERSWVEAIIKRADAIGADVYVKDNLVKIYPDLAIHKNIPWEVSK